MRRLLPIALLLAASLAAAQMKGVPASVTSVGKFSAEPHGVPASVTSLGPGGYHDRSYPSLTPFPTHLDCRGATCFPTTYPPIRTRAPRYPAYYPVYYPTYYPTYPQPPVIIINTAPPAAEADAEYDDEPPAPTVFERRRRTRPYAREERRYEEQGQPPADAVRQPEVRRDQQISAITPEESTVFVLLDGRQLELHNFAIVGDFVWNFDGEGPRKILLAQLDLEQTLKLNADRGTDLRLPHR